MSSNTTHTDTYLCTVENDNYGRDFISALRTLMKAESRRVRTRGRHGNRKVLFEILSESLNFQPNHCRDVPTKFAERLAIYVDQKKLVLENSGQVKMKKYKNRIVAITICPRCKSEVTEVDAFTGLCESCLCEPCIGCDNKTAWCKKQCEKYLFWKKEENT